MPVLYERRFAIPTKDHVLGAFACVSYGTGVPIVALHGGLQNYTAMLPLLRPYIESGRTAVSINLPGHGWKSDAFPFPNPTIDDFLAVHEGVLHSFGIGKYTGVGHSLGGVILAYAASKPNTNLATLCMIGSIDWNPLRFLPPNFVESVLEMSKSLYDPELDSSFDYEHINRTLTGNQIRDIGLQRTPTKAVLDILGIYPEYNVRPITKPTLIIQGQYDELIPIAETQAMIAATPTVVSRFIPGGHFVINQNPGLVINAMQTLAALEQQ